MRKHIFNAGPCKLPDSTLENVSKAVLDCRCPRRCCRRREGQPGSGGDDGACHAADDCYADLRVYIQKQG